MSRTTPSEVVAEVRSSVEAKLRNVPLIPFLEHPFPFVNVPIFRVPDGLRKVNPLCYTPRLVAIGPLLRDIPHLKPMEALKLRFLQEFIGMMNNNIDAIITFIMDHIQQIRLCYLETEKISQNNLCEMMLLDSVFIIQIFLMKQLKPSMFENYWWLCDLMHDFLLIENQIPLVIPYTIYTYHYCPSRGEGNHTNFTNLANNFFQDIMMATASLPPTLEYFSDTPILSKPKHFVEYLMTAYFRPQLGPTVPLLPLTQKKSNKEGSSKFFAGAESWRREYGFELGRNTSTSPASRLLEYGVKFKLGKNTTTSLVEIKFEPKDGILTIPPIKMNDWTETLFRNLIAFEHCQHLTPRYVTNYIIFMDSLIDTPEDVNILTDKNILQDELQDPKKVSQLFNNLYKEVITENRHCSQLSCDLNDYMKRHQLDALRYNLSVIIRLHHFKTPLSAYSLLGAVILLALTVVQTVCSVYQAKGMKM